MPRPAQCCRPAQVDDKTVIAPDLSLRGGQRPTWQSRSTRPHRGKATGETATAFPRLPRRFAPRNDTSGEREVHQCPPAVELLPTGRSLSAATGSVGAVTILTIACANRLCSTGRGMSLPATRLQSVLATVKMANASDLSLRGGRKPDVAISCRHSRFRRRLFHVPAGCCEIATAPAEPRNDKLESVSLLCHSEERSALGSPSGRAVTEGD